MTGRDLMQGCVIVVLLIAATATPPLNAEQSEAPADHEWQCDWKPAEYDAPIRYIEHTTLPPPTLSSTCTDLDGDGWSPDGGICGEIDCDDFEPDIHPGAPEICDGIDNDCDGAIEERLVDGYGVEHCLDMVIGEALVGEPIPVRLYAYDGSGNVDLRLNPIDTPYASAWTKNWYGVSYAVWDTVIPGYDYPGVYLVQARLMRDLYRSRLIVRQGVEIVCPDEYCEPEPLYFDFVTWMRERGYKESIITQYAENRLDIEMIAMRGDLTAKRHVPDPWVVTLYDVIPTDTEATFIGMDLGEAPDCTPASNYPDHCQPVRSADYEFLEDHFEQTFEVEFEFVYERMEIDYTDAFGEPTLRSWGDYDFALPSAFRDSFPLHSIVHIAISEWMGAPVSSNTTSGKAAYIYEDPSHLRTPEKFTHEWGHTYGLNHPFVYTGSGSEKRFWGFNSVMDNTYRFLPYDFLDLTDPLERYHFVPESGYRDEYTYVPEYNHHIIGSMQMPECGMVDPEILGVSVAHEDAAVITYQITLGNLGDIPVSYVPLAALDGDKFGMLIEERTIDRIAAGEAIEHFFTVPKSALGSGTAAFVLDKDDLIEEISDHPTTACTNLIKCGDVNNDASINSTDILELVNYVFKSGPPPYPEWVADANKSGGDVTSADILFLVNHVFRGGPTPSCYHS